MSRYQTHTVTDGDVTSFSIFGGGLFETVLSGHPSFDHIRELVEDDAEPDQLKVAISPGLRAYDRLRSVSERVTIAGRSLHFNGDRIDNALSRMIIDRLEAGDPDWRALVAFMERLAENPSDQSRRHLFRWLDERSVTITDDGYFIAYKGVQEDLGSVHAGPGIVDGQPMDGHLPNHPGSTIEFDRGRVDPNRESACSTGLHVGTLRYASTFAPVLLTVKVDPADVVAVPKDSQNEKVRVCRYQVLVAGSSHSHDLTATFPTYDPGADYGDEEDPDRDW